MSKFASLLLTAGLTSLILITECDAQVGGVVLGREGEPILRASVELWTPRGLIARSETDASGSFSFPASVAQDAAGLAVRARGYLAQMHTVEQPAENLRLTLEMIPIVLPGVTAMVAARPCPNSDEPRARQIWSETRARYSARTAELGVAYWASTSMSHVHEDEIGSSVDRSPMLFSIAIDSRTGDTWGGPGERRVFRDQELATELVRYGYAIRNTSGAVGSGEFRHWYYPAFGSHHAYHFVSETFGALHTFSMIGETPDTYRIGYCPTRSGSTIHGTLTIAKEGGLQSVDWSFVTPRDLEHAGGEAIFLPISASREENHALPSRSFDWRKLQGRSMYRQRETVFTCWQLGIGSAAPALPRIPPTQCLRSLAEVDDR